MLRLSLRCGALLTLAAALGQIGSPPQTVVDYPRLKFDSEVIEAPDCTQVPKLLSHGGSACMRKDIDYGFLSLRNGELGVAYGWAQAFPFLPGSGVASPFDVNHMSSKAACIFSLRGVLLA